MLIWGWRTQTRTLAMITFLCAYCRNPSAHAFVEVIKKFTLFFVPLFPIGTSHRLVCSWCQAQTTVPQNDVTNLLGRAHSQSMYPGGIPQPRPAVPDTPWPPMP
ncbi:hypothetical protein [Nocardia sp. NPDC056000]|uniref:hypothetical protein n=1 Tax=Nocardia sp. NPDC056000 TaxID=3345674 RepID=UPI0035DE2F9B